MRKGFKLATIGTLLLGAVASEGCATTTQALDMTKVRKGCAADAREKGGSPEAQFEQYGICVRTAREEAKAALASPTPAATQPKPTPAPEPQPEATGDGPDPEEGEKEALIKKYTEQFEELEGQYEGYLGVFESSDHGTPEQIDNALQQLEIYVEEVLDKAGSLLMAASNDLGADGVTSQIARLKLDLEVLIEAIYSKRAGDSEPVEEVEMTADHKAALGDLKHINKTLDQLDSEIQSILASPQSLDQKKSDLWKMLYKFSDMERGLTMLEGRAQGSVEVVTSWQATQARLKKTREAVKAKMIEIEKQKQRESEGATKEVSSPEALAAAQEFFKFFVIKYGEKIVKKVEIDEIKIHDLISVGEKMPPRLKGTLYESEWEDLKEKATYFTQCDVPILISADEDEDSGERTLEYYIFLDGETKRVVRAILLK